MKRLSSGVLLAVALAVVAWLTQQVEITFIGHAIIEGLVIAILLGMFYRNIFGLKQSLSAGVSFVAREVLEFAVLLLGASVNFVELFHQGTSLLLAIVLLVTFGLFVSQLFARALGLNKKLAILIAVGNSICGNSAIAAVAPVIDAEPNDVASSIAFTALLGVVVVVTLPFLIPVLGFSHYQYGALAGMSVYAVPQVIAAAGQVSDLSLRVATSVKLMRVLFIGPVVLFFALRKRSQRVDGEFKHHKLKLSQLVPWFVVGFMILAGLRTGEIVSAQFGQRLADIGKLLTIASMAALGLGVDFKTVFASGARVTAAVVASLVIMLATSVMLIHFLAIG